MWEKESIIDVQCQQENPKTPIHGSSGKLGKPRFPLERWTLFLSPGPFSCRHWASVMDSIYLILFDGTILSWYWTKKKFEK